ncbi:hypothetical protein [Streptococcus sanguinis]|uniref:Uncharacterized protein n=1 Tax=Streptococcus sanguinis TaxID=1305 RepID=A0A0B7GN96_STRSA|nr:hypothetical protein [Streptococcus sanguinis]CEL91166.1 conserved membrane protein of unknown function [Streptococcus sanguinis]
MIIIEFLKHLLFVFMIFTPFIAPAVLCFFVGWMIPREQITQKRIILVLALLIPVLLLISYFAPQILGLVFWSLIWFFIGLLRMKNYTKSQYWTRWLIFIACFSAYILLYLRFFGSLYFY